MRIWIKAIFITLAIALVVVLFDTYLFVDGKDEDTQNLVSETLITRKGDDPQTINSLKDSLLAAENSKNYNIFALRLSNSYAKLGKYDSAARYLAIIAQRFPNEESFKQTGLMYFSAFEQAEGDHEQAMLKQALFYLEKINVETASLNTRLAMAKLYLANNEPAKAEKLLETMVATDSTQQPALANLGNLRFQFNDYRGAEQCYSRLVKLDSTNVNYRYFLAVSVYKLGQTKRAKILFEQLKVSSIPEDLKADVEEYLNEIK